MKRNILIVIVLLFVIVLGSCVPAVDNNPVTRVNSTQGYGDYVVTEYTLSDGTRCALLFVYKGAGISCDWR